jgi:preprotein translocase subunit SecD
MFSTIRTRLLFIAALILLAVFFLFPRNITLRERGADGVMRDTVVTRVPLKRGLDLQGGMHLALELDQSKQVSADPKKDLDLALTVLRKRIDEFGVEEPVVQKVGDGRIVVELAGITDPARAKAIVQRSAFLEFKITNETGALEKALPAMDRTLRNLGIKGEVQPTKPATPSAVQELLGGDSIRDGAKDSTASGKKPVRAGTKDSARRADSAAADTAPVAGGVLSGLIQPAGPGGVPGEYLVPETAYIRVDSMLNIPVVARQLPRGLVLRWVDALPHLAPRTYVPIVSFHPERAGGRKFGEETGKHVGDYMAILLDGRVQGRPPVIQSQIGRNGQITLSGRTIQEAQDLAPGERLDP